MRNKELNLEFINWEFDAVIVELARYIEKGYTVASYRIQHSYLNEFEIDVTLVFKETIK